ncbi:hypothetical protein PIB30_101275 [Stylosanthes scabra]|uniref:Uncharacterized protein n=1 Tax=Stylosanthes scabra TaxID=79078 RepID=A0ABU6X015_9FABA|nr:hypothetical protein [Stylosanthes scabra]
MLDLVQEMRSMNENLQAFQLETRGQYQTMNTRIGRVERSVRAIHDHLALCADARIPATPDDTLIPQEPPIVGEAMTRTREARAKNPRQARQATPLNKNHLKSNNNPNSNINKISLQISTLTLTPPCPKSIGGLTNNKKKIGRALRPSTQEWTAWMIN